MRDFVITTDNTCDMPESFYRENQVGVLSLNYTIDGETYSFYNGMPEKEFYKRVRAGSMPVTSQANPEEAKELFASYVEKGYDVLHIAFSSGLSGSCGSARVGAEELMGEHPEAKVVVVDTLCASMGEGLILYKAIQLKKAGKTLEETAKWLEENKLHLCHNFTVDDLNHLYRGGRVSKATALLGTMIGVKPILHVDDEGHLINIDKVRGRKRSLIALVDRMEKQLANYQGENDVIFISHGDCQEDAQFVADQVKARFGIDSFMINYIGPTIGAHSGPGTVALFFMGEYR